MSSTASQRERHSVGALFEAAFRRFGAGFAGYLLYTLVAVAIPAAVFLAAGRLDVSDGVRYAVIGFAYGLAHFALAGAVTGLVTGAARSHLSALAATAVLGGAATGVLAALFPPLVILAYPVLVLMPIAVAAGDATVGSSLGRAFSIVRRELATAYALVLGIGLWTVANFLGWGIALSPVGQDLQRPLALLATTLIVWPLALLVERNFYGDVTGRLVIRPSGRERELRR